MIPLTRPDGSTLLVNPDRIETVEETPDTVITLADGKKLLVREAAMVVANRFRSYQRAIRSDARFGGRRRSDPPIDDDPGRTATRIGPSCAPHSLARGPPDRDRHPDRPGCAHGRHALIEGGSPAAYANPSAILIIFGGTFGATIASFSMAEFKRFPTLFKLAIKTRPSHDRGDAGPSGRRSPSALAARACSRSSRTWTRCEDPFLRKGLQMMIDGMEPEVVEEILELDTEAMQRRHATGIALFAAMGGYAPTMGVIGTVMGLVNVLGNLDEPGSPG